MKRLLSIFLSVLSLSAFGQGANTTVIQVPIYSPAYPTQTATMTENCLVTVPDDYATATTTKYALMVFWHGAGEKGTNAATIYTSSGAGGPAYIIAQGRMPTSFVNPADGQTYKFIFASPQFNTAAPGFDAGNGNLPAIQVDTVLGWLYSHYRIDTNRVYFTGLSAGGQTINTYVDRYYADLSNANGNFLPFNRKHNPAAYISMSAVIPQNSTISSSSIADSVAKYGYGYLAFGSPTDTHGQNNLAVAYYLNSRHPGYTITMQYTDPVTHQVTTWNGWAYTGGHCCWEQFYDPTFTIGGINIYQYALKSKLATTNNPTTAFAGPDQALNFGTTTATFAGSATAATGATITSTAWTQLTGATATITTPGSLTSTVTGLTTGSYSFRLTAHDNASTTATDDVVITVAAATPPIANAGTDQTITLPTASATLSGSGTGTGGAVVTDLLWTKVSGPGATTITGNTTQTPTVSGLQQGVYVFQLKATDNRGLIAFDNVQVTVNAAATGCAGTRKSMSVAVDGNGISLDYRNGILPGDTLVLSSLHKWSYFSMTGIRGTATCPIVVINDNGIVDMLAGIALYNCEYIHVTGTGSPGNTYGFYIHAESVANPVSRGNSLQISGRSAHIEMDHIQEYARTYCIWVKNEADCQDSINNWRIADIHLHHITAFNINQDGFYIGSTSPGGARTVGCSGLNYAPLPSRLGAIEIDHIILDSVGRTGIQISGGDSSYALIHDCHITRTGFENNPQQGSGIIFGGYTQGEVYNNYVHNTYQHGVSILGAGLVKVYNNDIDSSGMLQFPGVDTVTKNPGYTCISIDTRGTTNQWPNTVDNGPTAPKTPTVGAAKALTVQIYNNKVGTNDQFDNTLNGFYQIRVGAGFTPPQPWGTANQVYGNVQRDGVTPAVFGVNSNITYTTNGSVIPPNPPCNCMPVNIPVQFH